MIKKGWIKYRAHVGIGFNSKAMVLRTTPDVAAPQAAQIADNEMPVTPRNVARRAVRENPVMSRSLDRMVFRGRESQSGSLNDDDGSDETNNGRWIEEDEAVLVTGNLTEKASTDGTNKQW